MPGIELQRLFGPETPTGRYKHPASITELANGDLYLAWYGGDGEYLPGTAVYGTRFSHGTWSAPAKIAHDPFYSVGNPVIWQAPDGLVWLWYVIRPGATWSTSRIAVKVSSDGAQTWSDSSIVSFEEGTMVRGKPIVLANGDYLLPVWQETGFDQEMVGTATSSFFLRFDPRTRQWSQSTRIHSHSGALQPAVAQSMIHFSSPFAGAAEATVRNRAVSSCAANHMMAARLGRKARTPPCPTLMRPSTCCA